MNNRGTKRSSTNHSIGPILFAITEKGACFMDYVEQIKQTIKEQLTNKGYSTSGENGADKYVLDILLAEMGKLHERIELLEKGQA